MKMIDKDKVVAEIERRIANHNKELERASDEDFVSSWASDEENQKIALIALIPFLDTLEVKEVDLDFEQELYKAFGQVKDFTLGMRIAKHFYELGLKQRKENSYANLPT